MKMRYIDRTRAENEHIIAIGKVHWMIFARSISLCMFSIFILVATKGGLAAYLLHKAGAESGLLSSLTESANLIFFYTGLVVLAFACFEIIQAAIFMYSTELAVTTHRTLAKFGLIRRSTIELRSDRIEAISVDQSILGRIFNYGSISLQGIGGSKAPIPYITDPLAFRASALKQLPKRGE